MSSRLPDQPLISVVMPVYNRARYVGEAIQSILAQTYPDLELVVVDDGSTDDSPQIIRERADRDPRVTALFLEHGGVARAMNAGVQRARGELVARMDSDDVALPQRLAVQLEWLRRHNLDICGSNLMCFGDATGPIWFPETHQAIRHELLFRVGILFPTVLMRTDIYRAHPLDERAAFDDYALSTMLAPHYRLGNVPQFLLKHRSHAQQSHKTDAATFQQETRAYRRRAFRDLFPNATPDEWARFEHIVESTPFKSSHDLKRAGEWFIQLAAPPDRFLQQRMAMRWRATCRVSSVLGLTSYTLYQQCVPQIDPQSVPTDRMLWLACLLRLKPNSGIEKIVARARAARPRRSWTWGSRSA